MSSSDRRHHLKLLGAAIGMAAVTAVAGCGFQPLYGEQDGHPALTPRLAAIRVARIPERDGQQMANQLRDAFNPRSITVPAQYRLEVLLNQNTYDQLIRADNTAARTDTLLSATWTLRRISDGSVIVSGTSRSRNSHDVLDNDYANVVSTKADLDQAVQSISDDIETRVVAWFQTTS